jgi:DNA gyrase subunit A
MAKQLNYLVTGQIIPTPLHQEMERSYLEYAMSVIVGRALPDVRDGLKPVHRRILYAMYELGLLSDRPFRKCARVVGDVLGKYHPHGDQSVYEALVRMVQEFSSRYPLLSGHGNFGSVDNDPPAAMRYTETRLAALGEVAMLGDISEAIVDFTNNFDNSQQEPVVLPAQLPFLLLNGCSGIAVGMATNIPPHHLGELVDGLIALIDNPALPDAQLFSLIPGPDFPTGGEITDTSGINELYRTGKGIIPIKGVAKVETLRLDTRRRKERTAIVVSELPYQVNKAAWIEKVAELVNQGKIEGIADLRDESDRSGIRVVVELKREAEPRKILAQLYHQTALQTNFGAIFLTLVDNQPRQLPLRSILLEFLSFRETTLTRQYRHELGQQQEKLQLLGGFLKALDALDLVITILRQSPDGSSAKVRLCAELALNDRQAEGILALPLRRLTGLEQEKLRREFNEVQERIAALEHLLGDRQEFLKVLKKELRALKRKFNDSRRTRLLHSPPLPTPEKTPRPKKAPPSPTAPLLQLFSPQLPPPSAFLEITAQNRLYWHSETAPPTPQTEVITYREQVQDHTHFMVVLSSGKVYPVRLEEVPPQTGEPVYLDSLVPLAAATVISQGFFPRDSLLLVTEQGRAKRLLRSELEPLTGRGLALLKLREGDRLQYALAYQEEQELVLGTNGGRLLRFAVNEETLPLSGRQTQGHPLLRLRYGETLVGCAGVVPQDSLLLLSTLGYGKRLPLEALRVTRPGEIGTHALQFSHKSDSLVALEKVIPGQALRLLSDRGREFPLFPDRLSLSGKEGLGEIVAKLDSGELLTHISPYLNA